MMSFSPTNCGSRDTQVFEDVKCQKNKTSKEELKGLTTFHPVTSDSDKPLRRSQLYPWSSRELRLALAIGGSQEKTLPGELSTGAEQCTLSVLVIPSPVPNMY